MKNGVGKLWLIYNVQLYFYILINFPIVGDFLLFGDSNLLD